ncbi:MAG: redoxin domain-containing protein [Sumerlaeia bacterium]
MKSVLFHPVAVLACAAALSAGCGDSATTSSKAGQNDTASASTPVSAPSGVSEARETAPVAFRPGRESVGTPLPDLELPLFGSTTETLSLRGLIDGESFVGVIFHSPACPCANNCAEAVTKDLADEKYGRVKLIAIVSDPQMDYEWFADSLEAQVSDGTLPYPVLLDRNQEALRLFGAVRTPEVFLADREGIVRFWGAPESSLFPGSDGHRFYLKEAADALLAGEKPPLRRAEPIGCLISQPGIS